MTGRSRRRHDREVKIANRCRFIRENWRIRDADEWWPWMVPGRFAKIHPARVCSCAWCSPRHDKSERQKARRDIEERLRD